MIRSRQRLEETQLYKSAARGEANRPCRTAVNTVQRVNGQLLLAHLICLTLEQPNAFRLCQTSHISYLLKNPEPMSTNTLHTHASKHFGIQMQDWLCLTLIEHERIDFKIHKQHQNFARGKFYLSCLTVWCETSWKRDAPTTNGSCEQKQQMFLTPSPHFHTLVNNINIRSPHYNHTGKQPVISST